MNKYLFFLLFSLSCLTAFAQISYEPGYFIDNDNQKTICLIKNIDWKNNPSEITYKIDEEGKSQKATIEEIQEFGVDGHSRFVRKTIEIDRSTDLISALSDERNPIFKKETLFLRVLLEGKASLYKYEKRNLRRYFFDVNGGEVKQLIHKLYKVNNNQKKENNTFRSQLWQELKCEDIQIKKIKTIKYRQKELLKFFKKYNSCMGEEVLSYERKPNRDFFSLTLRPGLNSTSFSTHNRVSTDKSGDFGNQLSFRFGVETEFALPFNKDIWSITIEPTYRYYQSELKILNKNVKVDYKSLDLPIGVKYYFLMAENSKAYISVLYGLNITLDSAIKYDYGEDMDIRANGNFAFGVGYKYQDFSIEARYEAKRNLLNSYYYWKSDLQSFALIFGYTLF